VVDLRQKGASQSEIASPSFPFLRLSHEGGAKFCRRVGCNSSFHLTLWGSFRKLSSNVD